MSRHKDEARESHQALMAALADAHRAVSEARSLAAERAISSNSTLVEFEELFVEYEAAYERYREAIRNISKLSERNAGARVESAG